MSGFSVIGTSRTCFAGVVQLAAIMKGVEGAHAMAQIAQKGLNFAGNVALRVGSLGGAYNYAIEALAGGKVEEAFRKIFPATQRSYSVLGAAQYIGIRIVAFHALNFVAELIRGGAIKTEAYNTVLASVGLEMPLTKRVKVNDEQREHQMGGSRTRSKTIEMNATTRIIYAISAPFSYLKSFIPTSGRGE